MDCSPPASSVHGILQASILEWVCMPFSRASSPPRNWTSVSNVSCIYRRVLLVHGVFIIYRCIWHPTPVLLPGKSHGWRSLVGCSPWGRWGSDMTERLHFHSSLSCIGEGNATHSSVLAWRIPGTGEPGGLLSMGSHRVGHDWSDLVVVVVDLQLSQNKRVYLKSKAKHQTPLHLHIVVNYGKILLTMYIFWVRLFSSSI